MKTISFKCPRIAAGRAPSLPLARANLHPTRLLLLIFRKLIRLFREHPNRFVHAVKEMVPMHGIGDSQTLESFPRAHRFEAGNREADVRLRAMFNEFNENLRRGEVDFDDAACLRGCVKTLVEL
jgi:hypothetical protein